MAAPSGRLARLELPLGAELEQAIQAFDCVGDKHADDPVACRVCEFLCSHAYEAGIKHGFSATYLYIDPDVEPRIVGYVTLTLGEVRLTNSESRAFGDVSFSGFGAVKIAMIGVDCRHQKKGYGRLILEAVTEIARRFDSLIPARFLLADANVRKVKWYEARGFVRNRAKREVERGGEETISMRLDLTLPSDAASSAIAA